MSVIPLRFVISKLKEYGIDCEPFIAKNSNTLKERSQRSIIFYRKLLGISLLFSVPAFVVAMILPRTSASDWLMEGVGGTQLTRMALILWVLVTPVQFGVGWIFFVSAWKSLKHGHTNMSVLIVVGTMAAYTYSMIDVIRGILHKEMPGTRPAYSALLELITLSCWGFFIYDK